MINVSFEELAKARGVDTWDEPLHNDHQRMAMRVVTDFLRAPSNDVAKSDATSWINHAYDAGFNAGVVHERKTWRNKLAKMFDIPVAR